MSVPQFSDIMTAVNELDVETRRLLVELDWRTRWLGFPIFARLADGRAARWDGSWSSWSSR